MHKLELHINGNILNANSDYIAFNVQTQAEEFAALHYFFNYWLIILENQTRGILPFDLSDQYIGYLYFEQTENRFQVEYRYTTDDNGGWMYFAGQFPELITHLEQEPFDSVVMHLQLGKAEIVDAVNSLLAQVRLGTKVGYIRPDGSFAWPLGE